MTITEFLLARIAEDEATANSHYIQREDSFPFGSTISSEIPGMGLRLPGSDVTRYFTPKEFRDRFYEPAPNLRLLAECAAKRALVELAGLIHDKITWEWGGCQSWKEDGWQEGNEGTEIIRTLAAVYEDHIDYRGEWKP